MNWLRRLLPLGPHRPRHWLDTDTRGAWLVPVCLGVAFLGVWGPVFGAVLRSGK